MNNHKGFTLLELMISIVLGLLVVAAGLSLYLASQRSANVQNGLAELQQNSIFGISQLTHDLRHVNLNSKSSQRINNKFVGSGIIFSNANLPDSISPSAVTGFLTDQDKDFGGTTVKSDQLTIQFTPQYVESRGTITVGEDKKKAHTLSASTSMFDCEGRNVVNNTAQGQADADDADDLVVEKPVIVQRYYVAEMKRGNASYNPVRYALYCDAGYYNATDTTITGLDENGQQIIQNIDAFKVKLGVMDSDRNMRYVSIKEYVDDQMPASISATETKDHVNVVSVHVSVLAHSSNPIGADENIDNNKSFDMFYAGAESDKLKLKDAQKTNSKFIREVFSQVVAFRNTLGGEW